MNKTVTINVDRTRRGGYQLSIGVVDADGLGHGYRLAGPKYAGDSQPVLTRALDKRDVDEIRTYLRLWDEIHAAAGDELVSS